MDNCRKVRLFLFLFGFQAGVIQHTAQDQHAAQDLQQGRDLGKEEGCEDCSHHRLAELGGRDKGGGEVFQAPTEDAVAQDGGEDGQQKADDRGAEAVFQRSVALNQAGKHQHGGAGVVNQEGIHRGGDAVPNDPADEGVNRHGNGGQQGQNIAVELGSAAGIGVCDEHTARQRNGNGGSGFAGQASLQKQAEPQADPNDLGTNDGGGTGNTGMLQGFKP